MIYLFFVIISLVGGATNKRSAYDEGASFVRRQKVRTGSTETRIIHDRILQVVRSNLDADLHQLIELVGFEEEVRKVYFDLQEHSRLPICMYLELKKTVIIGDIYAKCGNVCPVILYRWLQFVVNYGEEPIDLLNGSVEMTPAQLTRMISGWRSTFEEDGWFVFRPTVWMMMAQGKGREETYSDLTTLGFTGTSLQLNDMWDNTRKKGRMEVCAHQVLLLHPEFTTAKQLRKLCFDMGTRTLSRRDIAYWREITDGQEVVVDGSTATMNDEQFDRLLKRLIEDSTLSRYQSVSPNSASSVSPVSTRASVPIMLDTADEEAAELEFILNELFGAGSFENY